MNPNDLVNGIVNVSVPVALLAALNVVGYVLSKLPENKIPNWTIPFILPLLGAILYPLVGSYTEVAKAAKVPWLVMSFYGIGIGGAAVGANQALRQWLGRNEPSKPNETKPAPFVEPPPAP